MIFLKWSEIDLNFEKLAQENGLIFKKLSVYHYQITGRFTVNFYPSKNSYYVNGAQKKCFYSDFSEVLNIAKGEFESVVSREKTERKGSSSRAKRKAIFMSGVDHCYVCGEKLGGWEKSTLEHKIPLSKGGSNRRDNLSLSHADCNMKKGNNL
jgi:hypothetical protein